MFKRDQAVFITEKCGDSNRLYTLQGIPDHTSRTCSRGGPYVATFGKEELDLEPSLPRPGFAPPWRTPCQASSQHGFQATSPPTSHFEWGNTRFKNLGQPSYIGLPVPFSRHANFSAFNTWSRLFLSLEARTKSELLFCSAFNDHHTSPRFPWLNGMNLLLVSWLLLLLK